MKPYIIEEIRSSQGNLLYSSPILESPRIYSQSLAEDMTGMLSRVTIDGTGRAAQVPNWEIAGKTGTSQSWRDAWFVGYTTRFVGGVWVGKDDDTPMAKVTGGAIPARIFSQMMTAALDGIAPEALPGAEHEDLQPELDVETESDQIGASKNSLAVASTAETTDGGLSAAPPGEATAGLGEIFD
jgi:penicillin-binding protein 1A